MQVKLTEEQIQLLIEALAHQVEATEDAEREDPGSTALPAWEELYGIVKASKEVICG